ncbi:ABC-type transport system periplasmic substrate-binding protein (probable substrate dipeptide/oligopeptide) (plasmid) [Haloferax gibbonsii]|uniref:ABC-type transport system periplasmic substrate-binding protein (Probable substrate dipeptide/oligopeptide) n=1 Tax=Haloferax gibbonsii TaxID=35746 RepID=A0A871BM12_HALGI|nr:ABC transporter substrate-binding protein [Haloferax gibbonsii]QOS13733.1 ABC-type transport system periplasmic substrate-binding protein (probable substrate dipeptide/oligopeptide) [Haloferax gibbonsii]
MDSQSSAESDKWISDDEWEDVSPQTRRRLLRNAFGATAGAAALAGCSSGGNEDTPTPLENEGGGGGSTTTDGESNGQSSGRTLDHIISLAPTNARFNPYGNAANFSFRWYWAMFDQLAVHDKVSNKTKGMVIEDWEYADSGQVAWNVRDSYTWHNGDDLTAEDVATQLKIGKLMQTVHKGYGAQPLYENVEQTGKYELTFDLVEPDISREIFEFGHMKRRAWLWAHRDIWGKYAEMFDDATTESERTSAQQELMQAVQQNVWDNANVPGNSVWEFVSGEENVAHFEPYDDYVSPFSDAEWSNGEITGDMIDYSLDWHRYPNQQQRTKAMQEGVIDVSYPPESQSARDRLKENGWGPADSLSEDQITPQMRSGAMGVLLNCQSDITGDPRVRKAIHHIVPRKPLVEWVPDYGTYWVEDRIPSGIGQDKEVPWFGGNSNWPSGDLAKLERYAHTEDDVDEQRATELLEAAGFSKSGNRWKDPNGENVTLRFYTATSDEEPMALRFAQIAKSYLDSFGLQTEVTAQEATIRAGKTMESGDWELLFDNWGGAKSGPPFLGFSNSFRVQESLSGQPLPSNDSWAMDRVVEVPYPIGDPAGDLQEVDVIDKLNELRTQMSDEERRQKVAEVSWIFNQSLPMMLINEEGGTGGYWLNHDNWATKPPNNNLNPAYRYEIVEIGQYSYCQYMAKMGTEYFHPAEGGE